MALVSFDIRFVTAARAARGAFLAPFFDQFVGKAYLGYGYHGDPAEYLGEQESQGVSFQKTVVLACASRLDGFLDVGREQTDGEGGCKNHEPLEPCVWVAFLPQKDPEEQMFVQVCVDNGPLVYPLEHDHFSEDLSLNLTVIRKFGHDKESVSAKKLVLHTSKVSTFNNVWIYSNMREVAKTVGKKNVLHKPGGVSKGIFPLTGTLAGCDLMHVGTHVVDQAGIGMSVRKKWIMLLQLVTTRCACVVDRK